MPDWTKSMQRTFEYFTVDPATWGDMDELKNVKGSTINRDSTVSTLGSATIDIVDSIGEAYVRIYLKTIQNGITERHPLGTFIVQTPSISFDGTKRNVSMDAYTPLIELKENQPPLGYSMLKGDNIMEIAHILTREHARAPVVKADSSETLANDFIANTNDTWLSFLTDLISNAKYTFELDEMGRILFAPKQDTASMQHVWEYKDDEISILYSDITMDHDLYNIPNAVEVIYSSGSSNYHVKVTNDDENSPISTVNRGREICHRVTNPDMSGDPTEEQIKEYAEQLLRNLSTLEYTITYTHGYCPVRVGDCVLLNYSRAGINDIKVMVISQTIECTSECKVTETAVYTSKLWR